MPPAGTTCRGYEIGGTAYSCHIVDPRTGRTAEETAIISATVVAPHAVDAGALATAFCVLTPEESGRLAASIPGLDYMLVSQGDLAPELVEALAGNALQAPRMQMVAAAGSPENRFAPAGDAGVWNSGFELDFGRHRRFRRFRASARAGPMLPCGSRTRTAFRSALWRSGFRRSDG